MKEYIYRWTINEDLSVPNNTIDVIFVNSGDIILRKGNYAHWYYDVKQAFNDYIAMVNGDDCGGWEGNEIEQYRNEEDVLTDPFTCGVYQWDGKSDIDSCFGANADEFCELLSHTIL